MTAGIPGAGIGGIFYLLSALLMPVREGWRVLHGRGTWRGAREALLQATIAAGVIGGIWFAGVLLGFWLAPGAAAAAERAGVAASTSSQIFGRAAVIAPLVTLAFILLATELMHLATRRVRPPA